MLADSPEPLAPRPFRVVEARQETHDVITLALDPVDGGAPIGFAPGQFNMLYVFGVGEAAISISGDPGDERLVHTIRGVGSVSRALCACGPGEVVGVRGPYGTSWPVAGARGRDVVIVAGGIGLAPLRPVLYQIVANRDAFGDVTLAYGARTPNDLLFRGELEAWRGAGIHVGVTVNTTNESWTGPIGVVTRLLAVAGFRPERTDAFICGPEIMMRYAVLDLQGRGVSRRHQYLSMERNMKCAVGFCGHCQLGPHFLCKHGPVFARPALNPWFDVRET